MPHTAQSITSQSALTGLIQRVTAGKPPAATAADPDTTRASVGFLTVQASRHEGRRSGYLNTVLSVRVGSAVGSCAVEPGELDETTVRDIVGRSVRELLAHPHRAVRVATADAYLASRTPHADDARARSLRIPAGGSLDKSLVRARAVASLVPAIGRVAVIGVVNSLLMALTERDIDYLACDFKGGRTEAGEPVRTDYRAAIEHADAVLASGMVLGNGTFEEIAVECHRRGLPLVLFAQSGAAIARELVGSGVHAVSAEPYPFFWLTGDPGDIYLYSTSDGVAA